MKNASENFLDQFSGIFYTASIYCTILLTVVRYIAICHFHKDHLIKKSKIKIYLVCVFLFSLIWNIPKWFNPKNKNGASNMSEFQNNRTEHDDNVPEFQNNRTEHDDED